MSFRTSLLGVFFLLTLSLILFPNRLVPAQEKDWDATVEAAKKEGKVTIYSGHPFRGYFSMLA
ncbi:MAG: hypothetical protein GTO40_13305, partial [Deltaproteobacteria bacterium]|nr:hypothetical protein [Deltaproteobacteria bacterium]